jgi:[protein-PII] uridylyltransferase
MLTASAPIDSPGLRTRREILEVLWRQGLKGRALLREHTQLIDSHLSHIFSDCPEAASGMALVAVGGYGRSELFPLSDIDLLLLHREEVEDKLSAVTQAIFYPLWDAGLEVGHSVRTIGACLTDAADDFFFRVSLLDARFITGDIELFNQLQEAYQKRFIDGQRLSFLEDMTCHRDERHRRFGLHSYLLEPHIKEIRGGLRDIQAMLWTAKVVFGLKDLASLRDAGLLTEDEHRAFEEAWEELIEIRNRLHYISSRKNDQLYFEHQEEIAKALSYRSTKGIMDVEHFMRRVYTHLQTIATTTDLFFEHVFEVLAKQSSLPQTDDSQEFEPGIIARKGRIRLSAPDQLKDNPQLLLRLFFHAAKSGLPVHHQTRKLIAANLQLVDDAFRADHQLSRLFIDILCQDKAPLAVLEAMQECGFLASFLPEFAHLKSLAQHDIYHVFTVDLHLLQTVAILHQLTIEHANIFSILTSPHILFLAGLLHDIGKGYGAGHQQKGAELCRQIGTRLGLDSRELELLEFGVANHLFLADTALRRDLDDTGLIKRCAQQVGNPEKLALLYLLSIADAKATGPTVWNDWKAALLLDLYLKIALLLEKTGEGPQDLSVSMEWIKEKVIARFGGHCPVDLGILPDDYLLNFPPEEIADHIQQSRALTPSDLIVLPQDKQGHWSVLILTRDRPGLLAKICGVISLNNLRLLSAQIFTWPDGTVVDVLNVQSVYEKSHADQDWRQFTSDLHKAINHRLGLEFRLRQKHQVSRKAQTKIQPPAKVVFDNEASETFTVMEVYAANLPGISYIITRTLSDFQINVFRAKIGTRSDQVVEVFYVLDYEGRKISEKEFMEEIRQSLLHATQP